MAVTAIAFALLSAAACGDESSGPGNTGGATSPDARVDTLADPPPTSVPTSAPTTEATSTEPPPTSAATTEAPPPTEPPPTTAVASIEETLDVFGPLGGQPVLEISFAREWVFVENDIGAVRIPGGVLVEQRHGSHAAPEPATLTAIDADGVVRWQRSLPGFAHELFVAAASAEPDVVLVRSVGGPDGDDVDWLFLSLLDGSPVVSLADAGAPAGLPPLSVSDRATAGRRAVLFATGSDAGSSAPPAELYRVDLVTTLVERIELTAELVAAFPNPGWFDFDDRGDIVLVGQAAIPPGRVIHAVYVGSWTTDPADIAGRVGIEPVLGQFGAEGLAAVDGFGEVVWSIPEYWRPGLERTALATDDAVVVATVCEGEPLEEVGICQPISTVGVSAAIGELLWRLPGLRSVPAGPADGVAIVDDGPFYDPAGGSVEPPGWVMVDTTTGTPIDGQAWSDPDTFYSGCCAEIENVTRDGGVVIAVGSRAISVWYPAALSGVTSPVVVP